MDHRQGLGSDGHRPVAARREEFLAIRLTDPSRPGAVALPYGRARDTGQEERTAGRDLDLDSGAVVRALREIHTYIVGVEHANMKPTAGSALQESDSTAETLYGARNPLYARTSRTTPPVHALP
jgi:hypothetical protein